MTNFIGTPSNYSLDNHGLTNLNTVFWSLPTPMLIENIVQRREGMMARLGAVVVRTGHHTGRSPNDKFIVKGGESEEKIWWGEINKPMTELCFQRLYDRMLAYFQGRDVFVQDALAGNHPHHAIPIRVITEYAWHSLFSRNMFLSIAEDSIPDHVPEYTVLHSPRFHALPEVDCTNSEVFIILNLTRKIILIGGSSYAGEIKKAIFTVLNYLLPQKDILTMHCSANQGSAGDVALFFGLSGTGKTTLSSDTERVLIGDDEHGWGKDGVFNFEGGSYAKTIRLRRELEPIIWDATNYFGTVLENVALDTRSREVNFDDGSLTENTRAAYPLKAIRNISAKSVVDHAKNVFFLSADAFGVMPPISKLSPAQAQYYFLSGYTSKLAGTESGLGTEPQATFSACFGAPFLPLHPKRYAELLAHRMEEHNVGVWLINTGWTGGPYGVGERISLEYTRAMVHAALQGELNDIPTWTDPNFGLSIPEHCPQVPDEVLMPRETWSDKDAYDQQVSKLVDSFRKNFTQFKDEVPETVASSGPKVRP
jgi:phosphoenolpyruvate carboxykinase (ATP)